MTPLEVEFKLLPGKQLPEALEALRQAGLPALPDLEAVPMKGDAGPTWVVSVSCGLETADDVCKSALAGVAQVVGIFGSPEGAPFQPR